MRAIKIELNARADGLAKGTAYGKYAKKNSLSLKEYMLKEGVEEKIQKVNMINAL